MPVASGPGPLRIAPDLFVLHGKRASWVLHPPQGRALLASPALAHELEALRSGDSIWNPSGRAALTSLLEEYGVLGRSGVRAERPCPRPVPTPTGLEIVVSESCDLACPHCLFGHAHSARARAMSAETADKALDRYLASGDGGARQLLDLSLCGGEPLTNWPVVRHVIECVERLAPPHQRRVRLHSNLVGLTPAMADHIAEAGVRVITSLDGLAPAHDGVRPFPDGRGSFSACVRGMALLHARGCPVEAVICTLTGGNLMAVEPGAFLDWLLERGVATLGLEIDLVGPLPAGAAEIVDILYAFLVQGRARDLAVHGTWMRPFENLAGLGIEDDAGGSPFCGGLAGHGVTVLPDGALRLCGFSSYPLGNIAEFGRGSSSRLATLAEARQRFATEHCRRCPLRMACGGQCQASLEQAQARGWEGFDLLCGVYLAATKRLVIDLCDTAHLPDGCEAFRPRTLPVPS